LPERLANRVCWVRDSKKSFNRLSSGSFGYARRRQDLRECFQR
jgi:hypothetical protein